MKFQRANGQGYVPARTESRLSNLVWPKGLATPDCAEEVIEHQEETAPAGAEHCGRLSLGENRRTAAASIAADRIQQWRASSLRSLS